MFGKVIVFGLFEMIKKKSEDHVPGSGYGNASRHKGSLFCWPHLSHYMGLV